MPSPDRTKCLRLGSPSTSRHAKASAHGTGCTVPQGSKPRSTGHRGTWGKPWPHGAPCRRDRSHVPRCTVRRGFEPGGTVDRAPCTVRVYTILGRARWNVWNVHRARPACADALRSRHGGPCALTPVHGARFTVHRATRLFTNLKTKPFDKKILLYYIMLNLINFQ